MIILKIFLGLIILGLILRLIQAFSNLKLTDLENMLELNENQKLGFLRRKGFKMISGSFIGNDYWFKGGFQNDELWFPHDNEKITEYNKLYGAKGFLNKGEDIEIFDRFYLAYRVKASYGDNFLKYAFKKGYVEVQNPNFEQEGFDYLGIEEREFEGQKYYLSHKGRFCKLFKSRNYELIQEIKNERDFYFYIIYKL